MNSWFPLLLEIPSFNQSCFPTADHPKPSSSLSVTCETDCKASIESFVYITLIIEKLLGTGSRALASTVECVTGRLQVATRGATGCLYGTSHGPCLRGCVLETFNGLDSFGRCEAAEGGWIVCWGDGGLWLQGVKKLFQWKFQKTPRCYPPCSLECWIMLDPWFCCLTTYGVLMSTHLWNAWSFDVPVWFDRLKRKFWFKSKISQTTGGSFPLQRRFPANLDFVFPWKVNNWGDMMPKKCWLVSLPSLIQMDL